MTAKWVKIFAGIAGGCTLALGTPAVASDDRPVVGIAEIEDSSGTVDQDRFIAMIETAILADRRFGIVEHSEFARMLNTANGDVRALEGADYIVQVTIVSLEANGRRDLAGGFLRGVLGSERGPKQSPCYRTKVRAEIDLRILDAGSGEEKHAERISEEHDPVTVCDEGRDIEASALLRASAHHIATGLASAVYPIAVAGHDDDSLILNFGHGALEPGDYLMIGKQGAVRVTEVDMEAARAEYATEFAFAPAVGAVATPTDRASVKALRRANRRR
jgi:hypothetical protein